MEFKEYLAIFKKYQKAFFATVGIFLLFGMGLFFLQPINYETNLTLNITRKAVQNTEQYTYADFYRLQADERFADTVVRWIDSPSVRADILRDAKVAKINGAFVAKRLSSQMIQITYKTKDVLSGKKLATSIENILNEKANLLDREQQDPSWFKVVAFEPVSIISEISFLTFFTASLMLGIFFGVWIVMGKHYFEK